MATLEATCTATTKQQVKDRLVRQGFLPIYVHDGMDSRTLIEGAVEAGCTVLEYTCRRHDACQMIPWIKQQFPHVAVLGATMIDGPQTAAFLKKNRSNFITVDEMVDLGVDGLVSFLRFRPATYERYADRLVMISGVATANECLDQLELGADFLKVIAASPGGANLVLTCGVATHSCLPFMVSGGMTIERTPQFIEAGVVISSAGFDLIVRPELDAGTTITKAVVTKRIKQMLAAVSDARQQYQPELFAAIQDGRDNLMSVGPWMC